MPRANPWQHATGKRARVREERTFTDGQTGFAVTLCFEALDEPAVGQAADLFLEHQAKYLQRRKDGAFLLPLPTPKGGIARLSEYLLRRIAMFQVMERPGLETDTWPAGEDRANVSWWYGVASEHPDLWEQVYQWAATLGSTGAPTGPYGEEPDPNPPGAASPPTIEDSTEP
jgi:hypothetical protein